MCATVTNPHLEAAKLPEHGAQQAVRNSRHMVLAARHACHTCKYQQLQV